MKITPADGIGGAAAALKQGPADLGVTLARKMGRNTERVAKKA